MTSQEAPAAPPAGIPANPAAAGGIPQNPAAAGIPENPAAAGGGAPGMPEGLAALLGDQNTMQMMAALQQRPDMLPTVLAEIQKTNPELMQTIIQNQGAFMQLLQGGMGGMGGMGGAPGGGAPGAPPPGSIMITPEEEAVLGRIHAMFPQIDRVQILQTYKACGEDEALTINLLMDNQADFMDQG